MKTIHKVVTMKSSRTSDPQPLPDCPECQYEIKKCKASPVPHSCDPIVQQAEADREQEYLADFQRQNRTSRTPVTPEVQFMEMAVVDAHVHAKCSDIREGQTAGKETLADPRFDRACELLRSLCDESPYFHPDACAGSIVMHDRWQKREAV